MNLSFRQQSVGETTYLVYDIEDNFEIDSFAMHMMAHNRMTNLVQTQIVWINEKRQLQFQITGLVKINSRISVPRPKREVLGLLNSILNAFEEVDAYMLDMECLLLDWEYIYVDGQGNCMLVYLPFDHAFGKDKISFLQEIVSRIQPDYQEKDPYLFDILNAFSRGAIQKLSDFREIIKKSAGILREEPKSARMEMQNEPKSVIAYSAPVKKEEKEVPKASVYNPATRHTASPKIPVVNIPGREPGAKEVSKVSLPSPGMEKKKTEKKNSEKKGFFRKDTEKKKFFAIPGKSKNMEKETSEEESRKDSDNHSTAFTYEKARQDDMYESYVDTVMIQEPAVMPTREEGTIVLGQPEVFLGISARLVRRLDGTVYRINRERTVIGSGAAADICISNNNAISRNHATIVWAGGECGIEDNQSRNGSYINGRRLQPGVMEPLYDGMKLKFANEDFEFFKE